MMWLLEGENSLKCVYSFDRIHERDRQADGHRKTAYAALMHSIARQKH